MPLGDDGVVVTLTPRRRVQVYVICSAMALASFYATVVFMALGEPVLVPLATAVVIIIVAGGFVWPPLANESGLLEAGRHLGWARRVYLLSNLVAAALIPVGILAIIVGPT